MLEVVDEEYMVSQGAPLASEAAPASLLVGLAGLLQGTPLEEVVPCWDAASGVAVGTAGMAAEVEHTAAAFWIKAI